MMRREWNCVRKRSGKNMSTVEIRRKGIGPALSYRYFAVWINGESIEVPIAKLRRTANGWIVSGFRKGREGTWRVEDVLTPRDNTLTIDRQWTYRGRSLSSVRLGMDLDVPFGKPDFWAIPYISMNGNPGAKTVPTGMSRNGEPWIFREERTTAPGLMTVESGGVVAGAYTEPGRGEERLCSCSIVPGKGRHTLRIFHPFREGPRTFLGAAFPGNSSVPEQGLYTGGSGFGRGLSVEDNDRFRRKFFVVLDRAPDKRHGYVRVWESAWRHLREPAALPVDTKKTEALLWRSLDHFWIQKGDVCGFATRVDRNGNRTKGFSPTLSTGWCAPTMMLAWLAIRRAIRARNHRLAEKAIQAVEFFVDHAPRKNGAYLTHFNVKTMTWSQSDVNAVQMGGAAYWLLQCADLLRKTTLFARRIDVRKWTKFALAVCDLAVRTQRADGSFCARFAPDGRCIAFERAMGIHLARAVLEAYRQTGNKDYLHAAERAAAFYIREMIDREAGYGDCTDLLNSTTENDGAFVPDFFIDLYRATGKKLYLEKAVRAAEFCLSFMFTYNLYLPPETECGMRGMRTRGFSAISPETGFVCFWFALQGNAFLELWKETGERRWKDYAAAIIRASLQMMTEPGDTFGLAEHLVGVRAEVIAVLDTVKGGHVWKKGMTGYTWHQPVWWPAAFNLLNFAWIKDRCPDFIKEIES